MSALAQPAPAPAGAGERAGAPEWVADNQRHLAAALARVRFFLERHAAGEGPAAAAAAPPAPPRPAAGRPALEALGRTFDLSPFERDVLLVAAGPELDAGFAELLARFHGRRADGRAAATFGLALAALPGAHWSATSPAGPLRFWRLVELAGGSPTQGALTIDERVLSFLTGIQHLDARLAPLLAPIEDPGSAGLVPSHLCHAEAIAAAWRRSSAEARPLPSVELTGADPAAQRGIAARAAGELGLALWRLPLGALPPAAADLDALLRLWDREAALSGAALLVDAARLGFAAGGADGGGDDPARGEALARLVESVRGPLLVATPHRLAAGSRPRLEVEVGPPDGREQKRIWEEVLGDAAGAFDGAIERVAGQFRLDLAALREAGLEAAGAAAAAAGEGGCGLDAVLWRACRARTRPALGALARRLEPRATSDDLVLPARQRAVLARLAAQVRQRHRVYESWGFAAKSGRGLGISALFTGASGTGKTMAAEVLAGELELDLYRIDLSAVVSKYIGETEKNLARVFDAAEGGGAILLFDEADALFGKRSEVKDSHDRYANIEIGYLLQRMEEYRGLAILTTNRRDALDSAFLRRLRFVVEFPFPDADARAEIWRRVFPPETPTAGLDAAKLARLTVAGGSIRNIALTAAFAAADEGGPVRMPHLLGAARLELEKLEKPLAEREIRGWVE